MSPEALPTRRFPLAAGTVPVTGAILALLLV